jgi:hypothetical protein
MVETGERRDIPRIIVPAVQTTLIRPGQGDMEIFLGLRSTIFFSGHHLAGKLTQERQIRKLG